MLWRLWIMGFVAFLVVLIVGGVLYWQSSFLDIDKFEAEGNVETQLADIVAISGIKKGDQIFALNLEAAQKSIRRLPWVLDVDIKRTWSGTITFKITERQPSAVAFSVYGFVLMDETGRVLKMLGTEKNCLEYAADFPNTTCIANLKAPFNLGASTSERNSSVVAITGIIQTTSLGALTKQVVLHPNRYATSLELKAGGWIYLGNPSERLETKLSNAHSVLMSDQLADSNQKLCGNAILDMSIEERGFLTPDPSC